MFSILLFQIVVFYNLSTFGHQKYSCSGCIKVEQLNKKILKMQSISLNLMYLTNCASRNVEM